MQSCRLRSSGWKNSQLLELIGVQQLAGIEHHRLELGPLAWNPRRGVQGFGAVAEYGIKAGARAAAAQQVAVQFSRRNGVAAGSQPSNLRILSAGETPRQADGAHGRFST